MTQWWLWTLVIGVTILIWYAFFQQIILDRPFGQNPAGNGLLIVFWLIFGIGFPLFIYLLQLRITVTKDSLNIRFFPLVNRTIPRNQISAIESVSYRPIMEYGGWGIRGYKDNRAYTAAGKRGVRITLKDGNKILIGSQTPEKLEEKLKPSV